jgi:hypothetical protein
MMVRGGLLRIKILWPAKKLHGAIRFTKFQNKRITFQNKRLDKPIEVCYNYINESEKRHSSLQLRIEILQFYFYKPPTKGD